MNTKERKAQIARENGKKGGRPKGYAAIQAEKAREIFVRKLEKELPSVIAMLIKQSKKGNMKATEILLDRAYGKALQPISGPDGADPVFNITLDESQLERIAGRIRNGNHPGKA